MIGEFGYFPHTAESNEEERGRTRKNEEERGRTRKNEEEERGRTRKNEEEEKFTHSHPHSIRNNHHPPLTGFDKNQHE